LTSFWTYDHKYIYANSCAVRDCKFSVSELYNFFVLGLLQYVNLSVQGAPIKNNAREEITYFSNGGADLSQTYRPCIWIFIQHILHILLKQLI